MLNSVCRSYPGFQLAALAQRIQKVAPDASDDGVNAVNSLFFLVLIAPRGDRQRPLTT